MFSHSQSEDLLTYTLPRIAFDLADEALYLEM